MTKRIAGAFVSVMVLGLGLAACVTPVTPSVTFEYSTFEGFPVISYVPEHPVAVLYVFHGSNGSADFAEKVETTAVLNSFIARGYGFVSTSSTERTGDKRWDQGNPSLTTNPDLARLTRLQDHLVATTALEASTPLFGIGMSNGARFVTLWGQTWRDAGYPVAAIWASMGRIADPVTAAGGLTVPTAFTTAINDFTSPPGPILASYAATVAKGTPTAFYVSQERTLSALQYLRIPGVDTSEANAIVQALIATGVWNASGQRIVSDVEQAVTQVTTAVLPASVRSVANEVGNETALQLAVHQFTAEYSAQVGAFFTAHLSAHLTARG
jgi:hypothetical protein